MDWEVKLALIPPVSYLDTCMQTRTQLMLPHMMANKEYAAKYRLFLNQSSQYVIMDNGAAEGEYMSPRKMIRLVEEYRPNEFAMTDYLADSKKTVKAAIDFLSAGSGFFRKSDIKVGLVAQGRSATEARWTVDTVLRSPNGHLVKVIYIPRLLVAHGGKRTRLEVAQDLAEAYPEMELHLFGAAPSWPGEAYDAGKLGEAIRSMDTSMPYNYGFYGRRIESLVRRKAVARPQDYFDLPREAFDRDTTMHNIETMKRWVRGWYIA